LFFDWKITNCNCCNLFENNEQSGLKNYSIDEEYSKRTSNEEELERNFFNM
jgi:hypothetical protein